MIVELKRDNGKRIFIEAYEVNEMENSVVVYHKNPEVDQREEFTKNHYKYIKVKNPGGQPNFLKRRREGQ